ncbi:UNVERIFIED_CONTAM: hypothetical protein FKN15_075109 [Acipenser sinensis]
MGKKQRQKQQRGAGRKPHRSSGKVDVCMTCLRGEEWCFEVGEVGRVSPDYYHSPPQEEEVEPEPQPQEEDGWEALLRSMGVQYCCCICGEWGHFPANRPLPPEEWPLPLHPPLPPAERESLLVPLLQPEGEEPLPPSQPEGEEPLPPSQPEGEEPLQTLPSRGEEQELPLPPTPPLGEVELLLPPSWPEAPLLPSPSPGPACCSASPGVASVSLASPRVAAGPPLPPEGPLLPPLPPEGPLLPPSPPEGPLPPLPVVTTGFALLGVAASPSWQQGILWPEPHKGELPATKKGGEVRRPPPPQPRPPPLCHSPAPGGWFPQPGLSDTQAACLYLWSLGLTPRLQYHQAQEVAWSPAPLPLVAQTSLHSRLGSHLCLGLQPTARLPALAIMARGSPPEFASRGSAAAVACGHYRLCFAWGRCQPFMAAGNTVAGAVQRGATGYEEGGGGEETTSTTAPTTTPVP